ncbi:MAG: hypothetical protein ACRBBS_13870 [Thalassovita sp.]
MKSVALAFATTLLTSTAVWADSSALKQLTLAQDVFAYGVEMQDPFAVMTAAKMTAAIHVTDVARDTQTRPGESVAGEGGDSDDLIMDAAEMFAIAAEFAGGDDHLIGLIEDAQAEGSRGRLGGASRTLNRLQSGYVDMVKLEFEGGTLAELAILGADGANLDLKVTDERGNTICNEQGLSDKLYCAWTPDSNGVYFAEVENVSSRRNSYYVLTN